jgi:hypothetical protein
MSTLDELIRTLPDAVPAADATERRALESARGVLREAIEAEGARPRGSSLTRPRTLRLVAVTAALVLSAAASGVAGDVASWFTGGEPEPDFPTPVVRSPDVEVASGTARRHWRIIANRSDQGICMALSISTPGGLKNGSGDCGWSDIRGDLPPDVRGDGSIPCLVSATRTAPCETLPLHWVDPVSGSGSHGELDRIIEFGQTAANVASVELVLANGTTMSAHLVERPLGPDIPLNVFWAVLGPEQGVKLHSADDPAAPGGVIAPCDNLVQMVIARNDEGEVLERRVPVWNANPLGDPQGPPPPPSVCGRD